MEEQYYEKALTLFQSKRFADAIRVLNELLSFNPNHDGGLSLSALCYLQTSEYEKAKTAIDAAISLRPDHPYHHYIKAVILTNTNKNKEALAEVNLAIEIDPHEADYFGLLSHIHYNLKDFKASLENADMALSLDSEHIDALNTRSRALLKLNRSEDSWQTIEDSLHNDPNNSHTHATYAWNLLEKNEVNKALEHFGEALRINPMNEYAQAGMMEALKARYLVYRWFLKYIFWIQSLGSNYQWGVIIGFSFVFRFINKLAITNEAWRPFLIPISILLFLVAITTWVADPISNLFLRLNKYGEHLLSREEKIASALVGTTLALSLLAVISYFIVGEIAMLLVAAVCFTMMIPLTNIYTPTKIKHATKFYAALMLLTGIVGIAEALYQGEFFNLFTTAYLFEFVAFQWVMNYFAIKHDNS